MSSSQIKLRSFPSEHLATADFSSDRYTPFEQQLLMSRGILYDSELDDSLAALDDPFLMLGMKAAVERLMHALDNQERVLIVGDYDADGATSTALLMKGLSSLGFRRLNYFLPDRFALGYGLSPGVIEAIDSGEKPDVIVTVDNGISSVAGVAAANAQGIDVVITDHHLPGYVLPQACAIVNPNQLGCVFKHKNLAGVGVAFHVLMALRKTLREQGFFDVTAGINEPNLASLLDLVALGTVADVVSLDAYNRIFVNQGLRRIRSGKACAGIQALLNIAKKEARWVKAQDLGFALGPRINAAGRLDDMTVGVELLLVNDAEVAALMAYELDALNQSRREIQSQMSEEAEAIVQQLLASEQQLPRVLCLFHPEWHQGVVGLVASKLKEALHRPVFVFAPDEDGESLKGSGRSINGIHLRDLLDAVAKSDEGLLDKFGGHAMAAGLSLSQHRFERFEQCANEVAQSFDSSLFDKTYWVDGALPETIDVDFAKRLEHLLPWGQGIEEPKFEGLFRIKQLRVLSAKHVKLVLREVRGDKCFDEIDAICFFADVPRWQDAFDYMQKNGSFLVRLVFSVSVNRFRAQEACQLLIDFIE